METQKSVIIFDGVCNFCNSSINYVLDHDKGDAFRITANQNEKGQEILKRFNKSLNDVDTFYLLENGVLYDRSTAVLRVTKKLGFPAALLYPFIIIPKFIRDFFYNLIAKNRYKIFGKEEACRLPTPSDRAKFLQ